MRPSFPKTLKCPACGEGYTVAAYATTGAGVLLEGALECRCDRPVPIIVGVPRIVPPPAASTLVSAHPDFYRRHPEFLPRDARATMGPTVLTLQAFGDEWSRFPDVLAVHGRIFEWYFDGPQAVAWTGLRVLDAGCGMGRWLHFAAKAGAEVVGLDLSRAVDVAAARDGDKADFVQADVRWPPFAPGSFDLVYCLGVLHHLEDPLSGVRALARLVRPGGELRFYVYRTLRGEPWWKRTLFVGVAGLRQLTTRLPYWAVHAMAWLVAGAATLVFLWPRRLLRRWPPGERVTRGLPLVHYADVPFQMVVSEQFDRLVAPIEGRFSKRDVEAWLRDVGFDIVAILPGLGWRAVGRRPPTGGTACAGR